jgi:exopolysaccharide biosynthesis polyprenyl glycosylphosphotransferase
MDIEENYLRKLLNSPTMLAQSERRAARVSDGMRRLRWAAGDSAQIGIFAAIAMGPVDLSQWSWHSVAAVAPVALVSALLAVVVRRSFATNFFAKESSASLLRRAVLGALVTFMAIAAFSLPWLPDPYAQLPRLVVCGIIAVAISTVLAISLAKWSLRREQDTSAVAVIGDTASTKNVTQALKAGRWPGWSASLLLNSDEPGDVGKLRMAVASGEIDIVIIAATESPDRVRNIVAALPDASARICVALDVPQQNANDILIWLVDLWRNPHDGIPGAIKRLIDISFSFIGILFLAPTLILAVIAIKLESRGPIIFKQWRFGACSRPFQVLKFRTMRVEASDETGAQRTIPNDPRVTRIGRLLRRTSIDELPQLFNVLRGEMSLVGPRAQALHMKIDGDLMFEALGDYPARHRVLPGITGWAQVNGSRGEIDTIEKAKHRTELDLWYIKNWSLWLDIRIIIRTALGGFATFNAD